MMSEHNTYTFSTILFRFVFNSTRQSAGAGVDGETLPMASVVCIADGVEDTVTETEGAPSSFSPFVAGRLPPTVCADPLFDVSPRPQPEVNGATTVTDCAAPPPV